MLRFFVSANEENVDVEIQWPDEVRPLPPSVHWYIALLLARARQAEDGDGDQRRLSGSAATGRSIPWAWRKGQIRLRTWAPSVLTSRTSSQPERARSRATSSGACIDQEITVTDPV